MARTTPSAEQLAPQTYIAVQQFFAWQMGLLDDGDGDAWADTFAEDAVFDEPGQPAPLLGREAIRVSVRARVARLSAERLTLRHWFSMLTARVEPDGRIHASNYALAMSTAPGAGLVLRGHVVCLDQLVPHGAGWLVAHRQIIPDSRALTPAG